MKKVKIFCKKLDSVDRLEDEVNKFFANLSDACEVETEVFMQNDGDNSLIAPYLVIVIWYEKHNKQDPNATQ